MITIQSDIIRHKGKQVLLLRFPYDKELINLTKKLPDAHWSNTHKAWYIDYTDDALNQVKALFNGVALLDTTLLEEKFAKIKNTCPDLKELKLSEEASDKIEKFKSWMRSRRYSDNTIGTYSDALRLFLKFYHNKSLCEINNDDVITFNNKYILANKLSASYQSQVVNAIKLFFKTIQNTQIIVDGIHRPKRPKLLPNVLSKEEIKQILNAHSNIKHKAMLSLIYSCGLRCGELLNLKPEHIDSKRSVIIIKQAKGRKDRIAPLSFKIVEMLREYYVACRPQVYLFEGQTKGQPYDARSLQQVLKQSLVKVKITKPVSLHWLRHSYATHLLENGTDLRYIQEILGHSSSKTTEIYTHVSTKNIQKIISPFDYL